VIDAATRTNVRFGGAHQSRIVAGSRRSLVLRPQMSGAHFLQLIKHALVVINALRTSHQMLAIKDHSRHAADTLLCPELLFFAYFGGKPLIVQNCGSLCPIKANLFGDFSQYCIIL